MLSLENKKLGRKAVVRDSRTPRMAAYFTQKLAPPPPARDWSKGQTSFGMMLNNSLGCCTISARGHAIQTWTLNSGNEVTIPDSEILQDYEQFCGYNPADPSTDAGGIEHDVLLAWTKLPTTDYPLATFMTVQPQHTGNIQQAVNLFGGVYLGVALPISAQSQEVWDVTQGPDAEPGSWGGHAIWVLAYDQAGLTCVTWGALQKLTWNWFTTYCDEAYALLSPAWIGTDDLAPSGFNIAQLEADLKMIV